MSGEAPRRPEHTDRLRATPSHRFNDSWTISQGSSAWAGKATASECFSQGSGGPSGATEQGVQADEAPLEAARGMVVGRERGSVVTVWVPASSGASQLIAGVRRTLGEARWIGCR